MVGTEVSILLSSISVHLSPMELVALSVMAVWKSLEVGILIKNGWIGQQLKSNKSHTSEIVRALVSPMNLLELIVKI